LLLSRRVEALDTARKIVRLDDAQVIPYERLVLATGARARQWPGMPEDAQQVFTLRTWDDAMALGRRLAQVRRLAVLGAGYVGLEVAASATMRGVEVSVFESAPRVMQRSVSAQTSELVERLHRQNGVQLHLGTRIHAVDAGGAATHDSVQLDTAGGHFTADALVVGIGAEPRTELARQAGLVCGHAIRIDASCRTSDPDVFAIGDCTEQALQAHAEPSRLESVQNATDQAKCAAAALTGKPLPAAPVPWFWSDQFGYRIQVAGRPALNDDAVLRTTAKSPLAQAVWYLRDDRVVAVEAIDAPEDFMAARQLIRTAQRIDRARLTNPDVALRSLVATA
jgi:3-phenylpropionate/trans-cinnamate dioxygenase ferredoxin reductase subunit